MVFVIEPSGAYGGRSLSSQPVVEELDAGGNLLVDDSSRKLRVAIKNNPSEATIAPDDDLIVQFSKGRATFRNLKIDKIGNDFTLQFFLYDKVAGTNTWTLNDLSLESSSFNVLLGVVSQVVMTKEPNGAVSDGQPIAVQPRAEVRVRLVVQRDAFI